MKSNDGKGKTAALKNVEGSRGVRGDEESVIEEREVENAENVAVG